MPMHLNMKPIQQWLDENAPHAIEKLAVAANLSSSGVRKLFAEDSNPSLATILSVAHAIGVNPAVLIVQRKAG